MLARINTLATIAFGATALFLLLSSFSLEKKKNSEGKNTFLITLYSVPSQRLSSFRISRTGSKDFSTAGLMTSGGTGIYKRLHERMRARKMGDLAKFLRIELAKRLGYPTLSEACETPGVADSLAPFLTFICFNVFRKPHDVENLNISLNWAHPEQAV